jgi:hypothetical protein
MRTPIAARAAILFCLSLSLMRGVQAQDITGYWLARTHLGPPENPGEYRDLLHVWKTKNGELSATLEFVDTGGKVVTVTSISVNGSRLVFQADSIKASYEGSINAEGSAISGTWTQPLFEEPFNLVRTSEPRTPSAKRPSDIDGYWSGTVRIPLDPGCDPASQEVQYSFHITNTVDGPTATFNIPDNGTLGWTATAVTREGSLVGIEMKQLAGGFQGTINKKKTVIEGSWTQYGRSFPLVLTRSKQLPKGIDRPGCSMNGVPAS